MLQRLRKVTDGLYRGSAPSPMDLMWLKEELGIKKVVSLDKESGEKINRACKMLGLKHIIVPLEPAHFNLNQSLIDFLKHDIKELLLDGGPTYVHCFAGKDRTGFAVALLQCQYLGKDPEDAIEEAKALGFGLGVDPKLTATFEKIIRRCKPVKKKDTNEADIVSNEREYIGDNRDSFLDEGHQGSFSPYLSVTKQNPQDALYNFIMDQSPTRENYLSSKPIKEHNQEDIVPMVGVYNNDAGGRGFGPSENNGGFIYD